MALAGLPRAWCSHAPGREAEGGQKHPCSCDQRGGGDRRPVLVPLHQRKGGGEDGEGVRGSGAIAGTADIVLELERVQQPRERALLALSRYPSTPGSLIIEHDPATGAWKAIGEGERAD